MKSLRDWVKLTLTPPTSLGPKKVWFKQFLSEASRIAIQSQTAEERDFLLTSQKKVLLNWGQAFVASSSYPSSSMQSPLTKSSFLAFLEVNSRQNWLAAEFLNSSLKDSLLPTIVVWEWWLSQRKPSTSCFSKKTTSEALNNRFWTFSQLRIIPASLCIVWGLSRHKFILLTPAGGHLRITKCPNIFTWRICNPPKTSSPHCHSRICLTKLTFKTMNNSFIVTYQHDRWYFCCWHHYMTGTCSWLWSRCLCHRLCGP